MEALRKILERSGCSLPDVYLRLKTLLDEPDYTMAEVAVLISSDSGLTTRLLRLVNSTYFGLPEEIKTVSHTLNILGTQQVHDLVLAASATKALSSISQEVLDMQTFWEESILCGLSSRNLAQECSVREREVLFVSGLLCDIGHLLLYADSPEKIRETVVEARADSNPLYRVERKIFGFDYAQLGAALLRHWQLSRSLWETVEFHIAPENAGEYQKNAAIVHIASLLTKAEQERGEFGRGTFRVLPAALAATGLRHEQCMAAYLDANQELHVMKKFLVDA